MPVHPSRIVALEAERGGRQRRYVPRQIGGGLGVEVVGEIGSAIDLFAPAECANYFKAADYEPE